MALLVQQGSCGSQAGGREPSFHGGTSPGIRENTPEKWYYGLSSVHRVASVEKCIMEGKTLFMKNKHYSYRESSKDQTLVRSL